MICIIGSGLSGMAAAAALVKRGFHPLLLDAGLEPEPEAQQLKQRLASSEPEEWRAGDLALWRRTGPTAANGIPRKLHFGSDFVYRNIDPIGTPDLRQASLSLSFAAGGFSNVWGAVISPPSAQETLNWPISQSSLARHFGAIDDLIGPQPTTPSGSPFTPDIPAYGELQPSQQTKAFYTDLASNRDKLAKDGIRFAWARLAAHDHDGPKESNCRYCGQCLYGCPFECIHSARQILAEYRAAGNIEYMPGVRVERLAPTIDGVRIEACTLADGSPLRLDARRVFVAAGLLSTARIVLASIQAYHVPLLVRHSDIFTLPLLRFHKTGTASREKLHTLCQLTMEIENTTIGKHPVHLQFYGYNDLYHHVLREKARPMAGLLQPVIRATAARLFTIFGYLHSDYSSRIELTLTHGGQLRLEGRPNPLARRIACTSARMLFRHRGSLKAFPLLPCLRLDLPGGGYHSGGIFPMSATPSSLETDTWGQLAALPGVHLIDASILPAIPAAPIAFTVMANAHRIAAECPINNEN